MNIKSIQLTKDQYDLLLAVHESHFLDLKAIEIAPAKLSQFVSAFANTGGGEIYIGIDEMEGLAGPTRSWRGFKDPEEANAILATIEEMAPLRNHFAAAFLEFAGAPGLLLHLTIFKSREVILASNGKAYVRRGAQKLPLDEAAFERLKYDKGITSFEDAVVNIDPLTVSNSLVTLEFLIKVVPSGEPQVWLQSQQLLVNGTPTVAATLLFAESPQSALPKRSAIKLLRYKTKAEGERDFLVFDPITIEGHVYELIYSSVDRAKTIIEEIEKLGTEGLEKVEYPEEALHEIITNAVLHRDYSIAADVQVRIFDNRIEIESPGKLPGHVTAANIRDEQFARNPKLVRLINKFPNPPNKDVGEGLDTTFEAMEKLRLKPPEIVEKDNSVLVILRHESLASPEQIVIEYLNSHSEITNSIGRDLTGIKSENSMKEVFYRLRDRKLLEAVPGKLGNKAAWKRTAGTSNENNDGELSLFK